MADSATFLSGLTDSGDHGTDERPKNFREAILWLDPKGMTPFTALSAKMKKESTDDPEFSWWEEVLDAKRAVIAAVAGTEASGSTNTLTLSTSTPAVGNPARQFKPGDLLLLYDASAGQPSNYAGTSDAPEILLVVSVTGNTTMLVQRCYAGSTTHVPIQATVDSVLCIGSAYAEGTTSADGIAAYPSKNKNYTQIFKTAFNQTNTKRATRYRTGDPFANDRKRAMFKHSEAMELACLFGVAKEDMTPAEGPRRTMGGLRYFFSSNVNPNVGAITEDFFLDTLSPLFNYNAGGAGDERIVYLGNGALNAIQKMIRDSSGVRISYAGTINFLKMKFLEYTTPQGSFFLKTHPLLNTDPVYNKSMFVTNGRGQIIRPLRGRDTKIQQNIQANDADQRKDQWLTEFGIEVHFERTQGYYGNIQ